MVKVLAFLSSIEKMFFQWISAAEGYRSGRNSLDPWQTGTA